MTVRETTNWTDRIPDRHRDAIARRFHIDRRGLAAFRIGVGALLLADLVLRSRDLVAFYTDGGVLPRTAHAELFPVLSELSFHTVSGTVLGQAVLFSIAAVFAVTMVLGYRTFPVTLVSVAFLLSLQARNPYVLNGGDTILLVLVFLGLFLPLGSRWSIDAWIGGDRSVGWDPRDGGDSRSSDHDDDGHVASIPSASLLLFVVVVYATNALYKFQSDLWMRGEAVRHIYHLDQFTVLLGPHLVAYQDLLVVVNWAWVGVLAFSWLLVFGTGRLRILVVSSFVGAHLGMLLTMRLGLFPLVMVASLLPFLPREIWDVVESRFVEPAGERAGLDRVDAIGERDRSPGSPSSGWGSESTHQAWRIRREWVSRIGAALVIGILLASFGWQVAVATDVGLPGNADTVVDPAQYRWAMFAPDPPQSDGWFVTSASLESGERVDALEGGPVSWDRPPNVADAYPTALWHRYLFELRHASETEYEHLAEYLCWRTSERQSADVDVLSIHYVEQPVGPDGVGVIESHERYRHTC